MTRAATAGLPPSSPSPARLRLENPLLLHRLEGLTLLSVFALWLVRQFRSSGFASLLLVPALATMLYALWSQRQNRAVHAHLDGHVLSLAFGLSTLRVNADRVACLQIEHDPCRMRIVLSDGRTLQLSQIDSRLASRFESAVAKCRGPEAFKLAGIPKFGRVSGWLSALPLLSGSVRPRVRIGEESVRIAWGPFSLERPLCQITHARTTAQGILLRFTDLKEIELYTHGGRGVTLGWSSYTLNRVVVEQLIAAQRRALSRSLAAYRKRIRAQDRDSD